MNRPHVTNVNARIFALFAAVAMACVLPGPAAAGVFMNINFDGQTDGNSVATNPSIALPISDPYALGGFPDAYPTYTGTTTVTNTNGFSNGGLMSTNQGGTGSNYLDTEFQVTAQLITLNFDINVLTVPGFDKGLPQAVPGAPYGQAFVINAFSLNPVERIWRFVAAPEADGSLMFGMRANDVNGTIIPLGSNPYNFGQTYHVSIAANYVTNTVNVSVDGVLLGNGLAFTTPVSENGGMAEFFFFQNGVEGIDNQVILDNIVATTAAVPEPGSLAVWSLVAGVFGFGTMRRRRSRAAA
jgi:hypothetical protein